MIFPTTECNLRCKHCASPPIKPTRWLALKQNGELDEETLDNISRGIDERTHLIFGGTEPLLHPKFIPMLDKICSRKKPKALRIMTNATMFQDSEYAMEFMRKAREAVGNKCRIWVYPSLDDMHAYGSLEPGNKRGEWDSRIHCVKNLIKAVMAEDGMYMIHSALPTEQREERYDEVIRKELGLPENKDKNYRGIDVLTLVKPTVSLERDPNIGHLDKYDVQTAVRKSEAMCLLMNRDNHWRVAVHPDGGVNQYHINCYERPKEWNAADKPLNQILNEMVVKWPHKKIDMRLAEIQKERRGLFVKRLPFKALNDIRETAGEITAIPSAVRNWTKRK